MPKTKQFSENLKNQIIELKKQVDENLIGRKRALADLENLKKRFEQEKEEFRRFAIEDLILQILPILDNFQRAIEHIKEEEKSSDWVSGIVYIKKQLEAVLNQMGVETILIAVGDEFNPEIAEAVETIEDPKIAPDKIAKILTDGYRLKGKLIRPAKVLVAR